jgi:hypothetical protein
MAIAPLGQTRFHASHRRASPRRLVSRLDALTAKQTELRRLQTETEAALTAFTPALLAKAFRGELLNHAPLSAVGAPSL